MPKQNINNKVKGRNKTDFYPDYMKRYRQLYSALSFYHNFLASPVGKEIAANKENNFF
jgi:hypothetical protein